MSAGHRLSATRAASRGVWRRFGDSNPEDPGRLLVPPDPCGVSTPFGWSSSVPHPGRSRGSAPHALSCSFEDVSSQPRTAASCPRPEGRRPTRPAMLPLLSFRALRHNPGPADPLAVVADPSATACHVRGLDTPFAASTTGPPGAQSAGASMGFALQGFPLVRERYSSRSPCPPDVAGRTHPPERECDGRPPSGLHSRDESVLSPASRRKPAVDAFLGFSPSESSPHPPGLSLVVTMPALTSLGGIDVPTLLDPRASRIEWIGLVRFRTAYSLEVSHLSTVTSLRSSSREAGSLLCLTQEAAP